MDSLDLDVSEGTPELKFNLWRKKRAETLDQWVGAQPARLRVVEETAAFAQMGVPAVDSPLPCAMELKIKLAHTSKRDEVGDVSRGDLAAVGTELETLGTDVTDSEFPSITVGLAGRLAEINAGVANSLPRLLRKMIRAETTLNAFNLVSRLQNVPITRSFVTWLATAIGTSAGEAIANGLLFKDELGYFPGIGFAFIIGLTVAAFGVGAGIGAAQLKRPTRGRRMFGGILLALMIALAAAFVLGMAHYRTALHLSEADAVAFARASFADSPLRPLADFSLVPYIILNFAGLALVAWKTIPMFGFLDLKRLQDAHEQTTNRVQERLRRGLDECDLAQQQALSGADAIAERTVANAALGKKLRKSCERIAFRFERDVEKIADSLAACEQLFRETVQACHPAGRHHPRFRKPPTRLAGETLEIDERFEAIVAALEARSVALRAALPDVIDAIHIQVKAAKEKLNEMAVQIESELRSNTGGVDNVLRFRR